MYLVTDSSSSLSYKLAAKFKKNAKSHVFHAKATINKQNKNQPGP